MAAHRGKTTALASMLAAAGVLTLAALKLLLVPVTRSYDLTDLVDLWSREERSLFLNGREMKLPPPSQDELACEIAGLFRDCLGGERTSDIGLRLDASCLVARAPPLRHRRIREIARNLLSVTPAPMAPRPQSQGRLPSP
jgi:hypothetical protein